MKPTRYISLIIALLSVLGIAAQQQQQQSQYALYNYRNDGDFNAWLNIDIDSITYSNIGLDSVEYDNIVTQEVWTPDSCYRIPIEAIDSIGFRAPEPEFKDGIFYIEEKHLPYILNADDLSIAFMSSTPNYLLPSNGQILYSDLEEEPFVMGFAGRVTEIINTADGIKYNCEPVSPSDVYDRYLDVFKVVSSEDEIDDISEANQVRRKARRKNIERDGTISAPEIKWNVGFNNYLSFDGKISNTFDYVISVGVTSKDYIKITHTKKVDYSVKTSIKSDDLVDMLTSDENGNKKYSPDPIWLPYSYPLVGCKFLQVYMNCGLYFEAKGSFELSAKLPFSSTSVDEYYFSSDNDWLPVHTESNEGGWPGMDEFLTNGKVELKLKGSAAFGPIVAIGISAWKPKFCSLSVQAKGGLELSGECSVDFTEIAQGEFSIYKTLSEDTKITTGLNLGVELVASIKDKNYQIASYRTTICKREKYLLPRFSIPEIPQYISGGGKDGLNPLAVYTNPSNDLLLPGKVGIGVYNSQGKVVSETYPIWFFGNDGWVNNSLSYDISKLSGGESYVVRPLFSLLSLLDIKASPATKIDVPDAMTLDKDAITLQKGKTAYVAINDGWGDFSAHTSMRMICDAEIATIGNRHFVKIIAKTKMAGSATITVKDLRSGETAAIRVTVTSNDVPEELVLSEEIITLQESESKIVYIITGSGNYTIESNNEKVATAVIEENMIVITAVGKGSASITVTDKETKLTAKIAVAVNKADGNDDSEVPVEIGLATSTSISPEIQWMANYMFFNEDKEYSYLYSNHVIGTPPADANGNPWYAYNYQLTNGQESWHVGKSPFSAGRYSIDTQHWTYNESGTVWTEEGIMADIYLRRHFTVDHELSDKILFSCSHDDAPAEWYLNGVLIRSVEDGCNYGTGWEYQDETYLTPEQRALIHTDGTVNVLSIHVHNNWGSALADGGFYEVTEGKSQKRLDQSIRPVRK